MEQMKLQVYINHGRIIAECPICHSAESVTVDRKTFICLVCWPQAAQTLRIAGRVVPNVKEVIEQAVSAAKERGQFFTLLFPKNIKGIMEALSHRPAQNRNWFPDETLQGIKAENEEHGV